MTDFRDEHDALERELLDYFRQVLGPRLVAPMAEELKAAVREGLAGLAERERRIDAALSDLQKDRLALANATRDQAAAIATEARRRLSDAPAGADPAILAAIEARLEALVGEVHGLARRGGGAASAASSGVSRNQLFIGGGLLAALSMAIGLLLGGLLLPWGRSGERADPPAVTASQQSSEADGSGETMTAETPVDQGWTVLRAANAEVCGALSGDDCTFGAAWQQADSAQRRAMMQAGLDLLAARARANYPACRRAGIAPPQVATWTATTRTTLVNLGGCLGVEAPDTPARNPSDAQQQEVMTWTLARLSAEAAR